MAAAKNSVESVYGANKLATKYDGNIYTFDLDKTYLATEFETLAGLVKIPFEDASEKRNIAGAAALVRELRKGAKKKDAPVPLYFISGSPKQLEKVIKKKFSLDGVGYDGILFKDFTSALKKFKFKRIIDKIGFKLSALLYARSVFPHKADEILFGDDSEYDATIYSIYSDVLSGRIEPFELMTVLKKWQVDYDERIQIEKNLNKLFDSGWRPRDAVKRIFIHLEMGSSPSDYLTLSSKVTPTRNYFQSAFLLFEMDCISRAGLYRIISELIRIYDFQLVNFLQSTEDLLKRRLIDKKEARNLVKLVAKGNPLALPIQWINEMRTEFDLIIEDFTRMPVFNAAKSNNPLSAVEQYLRYTPSRKI